MKLIVASDHAGFHLKRYLLERLAKKFEIIDVGSLNVSAKDDYPVYVAKAVKVMKKEKQSLGLFVCGSGVGMAMAANRNKEIRAANVESADAARRSRREDNANVLVLGSRLMNPAKALSITTAWLAARFTKEARHRRRLAMID